MTKETEARWEERIRQWRESGLSAEEFTEGKEYEASTLRWAASHLQSEKKSASTKSLRAKAPRQRRRSEQRRASSEVPRFVPVRTRSADAPRSEMVVEIGSARIRVTHGVDLALLGDIVRALQGVSR